MVHRLTGVVALPKDQGWLWLPAWPRPASHLMGAQKACLSNLAPHPRLLCRSPLMLTLGKGTEHHLCAHEPYHLTIWLILHTTSLFSNHLYSFLNFFPSTFIRFVLFFFLFFFNQTSWAEQFSSVAQSCLTLCDPMDCSTPGFPVHHQFLELAQTHDHRVSDAIQPSLPLSSPSLPAFNLSQHQGLFQWVTSSNQVAKVLEFQLQHQSFQWIFRTDFL